MSAIRALNLAQHWLASRADEDQARYIRSLMTGPLTTTIAATPAPSDGRRRPPAPLWWGNDEDASSSNFAAMASIRRR